MLSVLLIMHCCCCCCCCVTYSLLTLWNLFGVLRHPPIWSEDFHKSTILLQFFSVWALLSVITVSCDSLGSGVTVKAIVHVWLKHHAQCFFRKPCSWIGFSVC